MLPVAVIHQAAALVHHFHSELLILHVVKPLSYLGGSETTHELLKEDIANEHAKLKTCLGPELDGARHLVLKGNPAHEILRVAHDEKIDLIVMPTHGYGAFDRLILGSVTAKILHGSECPVWAGAHVQDVPIGQFAIHNILCGVDFGPRSPRTVRWAQDVATEFGAQLTLVHVTPGVEIYGPGGRHILSEMKEELVNSAMKHMEKIQLETGTKGKVYIGSGEVPKVMNQAARDTRADLIVLGHRCIGGRFGTTAYGIIRDAGIPVLSV